MCFIHLRKTYNQRSICDLVGKLSARKKYFIVVQNSFHILKSLQQISAEILNHLKKYLTHFQYLEKKHLLDTIQALVLKARLS